MNPVVIGAYDSHIQINDPSIPTVATAIWPGPALAALSAYRKV